MVADCTDNFSAEQRVQLELFEALAARNPQAMSSVATAALSRTVARPTNIQVLLLKTALLGHIASGNVALALPLVKQYLPQPISPTDNLELQTLRAGAGAGAARSAESINTRA